MIKVSPSSVNKWGWKIQARFQIKLNGRDLSVLKRIHNFFGVGTITVPQTDAVFTVTSVKDLVNVILLHFEAYPLLTQKFAGFSLFKRVVLMLEAKEHSSLEGIIKIIGLKSAINLGLYKSSINFFFLILN